MRVLLWRGWQPLFGFPATFSNLEHNSVGGTCSQLLWHARALVRLGHEVQVLGATASTLWEEGVEFIGSNGPEDQQRLAGRRVVTEPDMVLLEGAYAAARFLREAFPTTYLVHVGQNIDRYGAEGAFAQQRLIDRYAMVSPGHLAQCCARFPKLRHKFGLLRNIVSDERALAARDGRAEPGRVVWVGNWNKQGLRQWAETMSEVMARRANVTWRLFGPAYDRTGASLPPHILAGLPFPTGRVTVSSVPIGRLLAELARAQVVVTSLGNETAGISALDAQSAGRPVLSGNDLVYKYTNPDGCGLRVTTAAERMSAICRLLDDEALCDELGAAGREHVSGSYSARNLEDDFRMLIRCQQLHTRLHGQFNSAPSNVREWLRENGERLERKLLSWRRPSSTPVRVGQ